tara:strand:+ start:271 stop:1785 length:1515 start_codon:yes stop_codon:yes gene_type:complete
MALDPSIALGVRPLQLPDPMNQLAQFSQIQNAQNQNALARYQLNAAQRAEQGQTALGQAYGKFYTDQSTGGAGQPSFGQMRQQIVQQLSTSAPHLIPGELAKIAAMEKEALQTKELQGKIDLQAPELQNKVSKQYKDQLVNVNSYDSAVKWLESQYKNPVLGPIVSQEPFESAIKQIPKDPTAFQDWKNRNALGIEEYIKQNKPQLSTKDIGGSVTDRLFRPMSGEITEVSTTKKTPTFADITGQGQLALAKAKFAFEQANPTMSIQEDPSGLLAVNTKTGVATPIVYGPTGFQAAPAAAPAASMMRQPPAALPGQRTPAIPGMASVLDQTAAPAPAAMPMPAVTGERVPGQPVSGKGKPPPEAYAKQALGVANTNDALEKMQDTMKNFKSSDMLNPTRRAELGQAHAATLLFAKELFNLGVLNGGDERIINSVINNPIDFSSTAVPIEAIKKQARDLQGVVDRTNKNLSIIYKLPPLKLERSAPLSGANDIHSQAEAILRGTP